MDRKQDELAEILSAEIEDHSEDAKFMKNVNKIEEKKNIYLALLLQVIATIFFTLMNVNVRYVFIENKSVNGFDYLLIRSISMLLLSAIQAYVQKVNLFDLQQESKWKVITYGIIGSSGLPVFYYGFRYIPTSIGILIFYIHPLIVAIIASFVLNEILTKEKLLVAFGSFAGAAVLLLHKNVAPGDVDHYYLGAMLAFYFCCTACVMAIIARMVRGQIHYSICPIYYNIFLGGGMFLCFIIYPTMFNVDFLTTFDVVMFLISGVFSFVGNNLRFLAFKHEEASKVSPFGYFEIFFTLLFDIFMFKYSFALTDVIGGIFIMVRYFPDCINYFSLICIFYFFYLFHI